MEAPLLQTKFYIPSPRPNLVPRPRLTERLNEGVHRKFTLISTPAGFGKTTLVSDWLRQLDVPIAWVSLDENDNDPARFLTYFISAFQQFDSSIGQASQVILQSPQLPPLETLITTIINDVSAAFTDTRCVLVLDDYHVIETQPIHEALAFLLDHLPPQIHLVIATRSDPFLPLSRLRARNEMAELRADDLRFLPQEIAIFFNQVMRLGLSGEDVDTLENRTEGWIAGLQLTAIAIQSHLSMQGQDDASDFISTFAGDDRYIVDYLVDEVLSRQSASIQDFLLQTSILARFNSALCDTVTARDGEDSRTILEYLERTNLFIVPLDNTRQWYRYHHLFADLLSVRLRQSQPTLVATLHNRVSEWFEQNDLPAEAVNHALAAGEFERAARLIERVAETLWRRGEQTKLLSWLEALPPEQVYARPRLCIFHAWGRFVSGQQSAAEQCLQAAEQSLNSSAAGDALSQDPDQRYGLDQRELQGRVSAIRAFMASYRGDIPDIIQFSRQALEYLPEQDTVWRSGAAIALGDAHGFNGDLEKANQARSMALKASNVTGNIYLILIASLKLAVTQRLQGRLQETIEICQQQLQLVNKNGLSQTAMVGWLFAIWGEILAELNDLDEAIQYAQKGTELTERGRDVAMLGWSYLCLVRVLFSKGDVAGAEKIIQKMEKIDQESDVPPWVTNQIAAWNGRIWLAQGKLEAVAQWVQERGLDIDGEIPFLREIEYVVLARILVAQGRLDEAQDLLARLLKRAKMGGRTARVIEILIRQALAFQTQGDTAQALTTLEQALFLAQPEGFIRTFVDEGEPMAKLLTKMKTEDPRLNEYIHKLIAAFERKEIHPSALAKQGVIPQPLLDQPSVNQPEVDPLSERELEVLRLFKTDLSGPEIARELMISLSTVRTHTKNIYGKLDVHNRRQAVAKAEDLGLL